MTSNMSICVPHGATSQTCGVKFDSLRDDEDVRNRPQPPFLYLRAGGVYHRTFAIQCWGSSTSNLSHLSVPLR